MSYCSLSDSQGLHKGDRGKRHVHAINVSYTRLTHCSRSGWCVIRAVDVSLGSMIWDTTQRRWERMVSLLLHVGRHIVNARRCIIDAGYVLRTRDVHEQCVVLTVDILCSRLTHCACSWRVMLAVDALCTWLMYRACSWCIVHMVDTSCSQLTHRAHGWRIVCGVMHHARLLDRAGDAVELVQNGDVADTYLVAHWQPYPFPFPFPQTGINPHRYESGRTQNKSGRDGKGESGQDGERESGQDNERESRRDGKRESRRDERVARGRARGMSRVCRIPRWGDDGWHVPKWSVRSAWRGRMAWSVEIQSGEKKRTYKKHTNMQGRPHSWPGALQSCHCRRERT